MFREQCLQEIFKLCLSSLNRTLAFAEGAAEPVATQQHQIRKASLDLALEILTFDFIGLRGGEEGDDVGVLHVPGSWQDVFEDLSPLKYILY